MSKELLIIKSPNSVIVATNPQQSIELINPNSISDYNDKTGMLEFGADHPVVFDSNGEIYMEIGKELVYGVLNVKERLKEYFDRGYIGVNMDFLKSKNEDDATRRANWILESLEREETISDLGTKRALSWKTKPPEQRQYSGGPGVWESKAPQEYDGKTWTSNWSGEFKLRGSGGWKSHEPGDDYYKEYQKK